MCVKIKHLLQKCLACIGYQGMDGFFQVLHVRLIAWTKHMFRENGPVDSPCTVSHVCFGTLLLGRQHRCTVFDPTQSIPVAHTHTLDMQETRETADVHTLGAVIKGYGHAG